MELASTPTLLTVFLASLIGSPHCAGMCGGFVVFYSSKGSGPAVALHTTYHLGRLLTYSVLGVLAGLLGQTVNLMGAAKGISSLMGIVTALLLIFWGIKSLVGSSPNRNPGVVQIGGSFTKSAYRKILEDSSPGSWGRRTFTLGMLSTCLPCGWLYTFVLVAASTGSPLWGMLTMGAFWLGTVPILAALGVVSGGVGRRLGKYTPRITAGLLLFAGLYSLSIHLGLFQDHSHHHHHMKSGVEAPSEGAGRRHMLD